MCGATIAWARSRRRGSGVKSERHSTLDHEHANRDSFGLARPLRSRTRCWCSSLGAFIHGLETPVGRQQGRPRAVEERGEHLGRRAGEDLA